MVGKSSRQPVERADSSLSHKYLTILVFTEGSPKTRKWRIPHRALVRIAVVLGFLLIGGVAGSAHYYQVVGAAAASQSLRDENQQLRSDLTRTRERVEHITSALDRLERYGHKLRAITLMPDSDRHLAVGPVSATEVEDADSPSAWVMQNDLSEPQTLSSELEVLSTGVARQEASLQELQAYFEDQKSLLASTPSIWPTHGYVTSDFGGRDDPFSSGRQLHHALDIATTYGAPVIAPADGLVIFSGVESGYGNVIVISHGQSLCTRYAHLSVIQVKLGDRVKRGDRIGAVGSTGLSTGPHLHYEVRINGIPENPRKFILE